MATYRDYLGSYRLLRQINPGKFCDVWEAKKDDDENRVCIKALRSDFADSKEETARLKREYEVGKDMSHEKVIAVYDYLTAPTPHLIMEFFNAPNLKELVWQGAEWVTPALPKIIEDCAEGLAYFHRKGWVHRDIKPDNFLVSQNGGVKLIDFSIAQKSGSSFAQILGIRSKVMGTRSYMSPEQIRGKGLDSRADVYSFGCMIFQLFSGKMPYTGDNSDELLMKHLKAPIPTLQAVTDEVHPDFAKLVQRMMAKRPEDRPENMSHFLREYRETRLFKTRKRLAERSPTAGKKKPE